jgi:hypothetical protein
MSVSDNFGQPEKALGIPDVELTADEAWAIIWRTTVLAPDNALEHAFVVEQFFRMFQAVDGLRELTERAAQDACDVSASDVPTMPLAELMNRGVESVPYVEALEGETMTENGIDPAYTGIIAQLALTSVRLAILQAHGEHEQSPLPSTFYVPNDLV